MFTRLMDAMFGCRHARYSFPITVRAGSRRNPTAQRTGTYVACLDCGKEFRYDWHEMKIVGSQTRDTAPSMVTKIVTKMVTKVVTKEAA
jgi:hypothetical protein